jgi:hypothetical protein
MDDDRKKKIYVGGKEYEPEPSAIDRLKEGFDTTDNRAQVEAIRKRRMKLGS